MILGYSIAESEISFSDFKFRKSKIHDKAVLIELNEIDKSEEIRFENFILTGNSKCIGDFAELNDISTFTIIVINNFLIDEYVEFQKGFDLQLTTP
jgi:hypothetical protein